MGTLGFNRRGSFSFPSGGFGRNVLIFGVYMSFFAHIDNKKRRISLSLRNRSNARIRTYTNCRKTVLD